MTGTRRAACSWWLAPLAALGAALGGCGPPKQGVLRLQGGPADALVTVDDRYVGKLGAASRFGVRLPVGEHAVTIEKPGYFPFDVLVRVPADGSVTVPVALDEIPD
jgi:hypothetical protein